jgi:hypothetical protein
MNDNLSRPILTFKLDHNSNTFPFSTLFNNILSDFFSILNNYLYKKNNTRPNGPSFGARVAAGPGYPPKTLILTNLII